MGSKQQLHTHEMHAHLECTSQCSSRTEPSTRWQKLFVFLLEPSLFLTMLQEYVSACEMGFEKRVVELNTAKTFLVFGLASAVPWLLCLVV